MAGTAVLGRLTGWRPVEVLEAYDETPRVRTLVLDAPDWPGHRAGQHLDVRLTAEDGYHAERSYSIASAPGGPVEITVELLDDGEVSPYLAGEAWRPATSSRFAARSAAGSCGRRVRTGLSCSLGAGRAWFP